MNRNKLDFYLSLVLGFSALLAPHSVAAQSSSGIDQCGPAGGPTCGSSTGSTSSTSSAGAYRSAPRPANNGNNGTTAAQAFIQQTNPMIEAAAAWGRAEQQRLQDEEYEDELEYRRRQDAANQAQRVRSSAPSALVTSGSQLRQSLSSASSDPFAEFTSSEPVTTLEAIAEASNRAMFPEDSANAKEATTYGNDAERARAKAIVTVDEFGVRCLTEMGRTTKHLVTGSVVYTLEIANRCATGRWVNAILGNGKTIHAPIGRAGLGRTSIIRCSDSAYGSCGGIVEWHESD